MNDLVLTVQVNATPAQVWSVWTTTAGLRAFLTPNARVDLRPGGDFEILFDMSQPEGARGSEGCVVVGFEEDRSFTFTWNFPPVLASIRNQHTVVHLDITPSEEGSLVTLTQRGFKSDGEWPAGRLYFEVAWARVLDALKTHFRQ